MAFLFFTLNLSAQESELRMASEQLNRPELKLYPNPAYGESVELITHSKATKEVRVYDVFGKIVLEQKVFRNTLVISSLEPGIYVLQIKQEQHSFNRKLVIK